MKNINVRNLLCTVGIVLLAALLSACGPSSLPTTPTASPTQTSTTGNGTTFQSLSGVNFTISYPTGWKKSQQSLPGGASGPGAKPTENIYGFVAQDSITGFHIVRNGDEQAVGGMIGMLIGQYECQPGDASVPLQVTVGGAAWVQSDLTCKVSGKNYEVRELVNGSPQYGQTVIMYGGYQQAVGGVIPDFAHVQTAYFDPMLKSFKFN